MPITFRCVCGRELVARDDYAGKQIRCGLCGAVQVVPAESTPPPEHPPSGQTPPSPPGAQVSPFGWPGPPPPRPGYGPGAYPGHAQYSPGSPQAPVPPPYWPPYGWYQQHAPPAPPYRPRFWQRPEQAGRAAAITSLVFGTIGIGGHAFGCCLMWCWGIILMLGCSLTAMIVGWAGVSSAVTPDVRANARLGRALGIIGLIAGIIFLIFVQIPLVKQMLEVQRLQ